jgi:hypothetical protein
VLLDRQGACDKARIVPSLAFQHRLTGGYALSPEAAAHLGEPIALFLTARAESLLELWRARALAVAGTIEARHFADARAVAGSLRFAAGRAEYQLAFDANDGRACAFLGQQELALRRPPMGFSVLVGTFTHAGQAIGRARLRLDPRSDLRQLWSSLTLTRAGSAGIPRRDVAWRQSLRCALSTRPRATNPGA